MPKDCLIWIVAAHSKVYRYKISVYDKHPRAGHNTKHLDKGLRLILSPFHGGYSLRSKEGIHLVSIECVFHS